MSSVLRLKTLGGLTISRDGVPVEGAGAQRRRLALLALLAAAGERAMPREKILALLWPESDPERARKNLAQAVYALRRDLGDEELILGTNDLRLNPDLVSSDLAEFQRATAEGRHDEAVRLYGGPFLDGVAFDAAPEFERWAETERVHHAHEFTAALEQVAASATARGEHRAAIGLWRRLANADPLNAKAALGLMRAFAAVGDRTAALQHFRVYEMLLRQELDLVPDAEVRRFADALRQEKPEPAGQPATFPPLASVPETTLPGTPAVARPAPPAAASGRRIVSGFTDEYARPRPLPDRAELPAPIPVAKPSGERSAPRTRRTLWGIAAGFVLAIAIAVLTTARFASRPRGAPPVSQVVAVGLIQDYTHAGEALGRPLADMLATDLARTRDLQVISTARMYELMSQGGTMTDTAAAVIRAARAAGATQLLDGALYRNGHGRLRLDLRRTDLASGNMIRSYSAEAPDLFGLVDSARKAIASMVDGAGNASLADVTTRSVVAYRLYEEGIRAFFSADPVSARRLLAQALDEDSTFAMAAYWLARAEGSFNDESVITGLARAVRLSARASDRERLTILAGWANAVDDPSRIAIAETLTVRYPAEPDGYLWLGHGRIWGGDFLGAIAPLRRVIAMDSLDLKKDPKAPTTPIPCHACEAYMELIADYQMLDSLQAAERVAGEWARAQPWNFVALGQISSVLNFQNRFAEAMAADQAVVAVAPQLPREGFRAAIAMRSGDFSTAKFYYRQLLPGPSKAEGLKWLSIILRIEGRPQEALAAAQQLRGTERVSRRDAAPYNALFEAQVYFDLGQFRRAAALFDSVSRAPRDSTPSQLARNQVWTQALRATALAAAGDTALLPALADSIERWGRLSAYGRDQRLHHHVRGLLFEARGQLDAAESELRQSVFSPTTGYTRTNVELAKVLMRESRPREAAYWAEAGLRGPADAGNTYVTQTELAEVAALAWDAAGMKDSAVVRYRQVVHNWSDAEPAFAARVERARLRLAALSASE
jgi:DNA-binding SARP family transcriptional activator/TolB-like protein